MVDTCADPPAELHAHDATRATGGAGDSTAGVAEASVTTSPSHDWRRAIGVGVAVFVVSRVVVIGGAYCLAIFDAMALRARRLPAPNSTRAMIENYLLQARGGRSDGRWLQEIAEHGYQTELPKAISLIANNGGATAGFLPGYPLLARWFDVILPGGLDHALLGVNLVVGVVAMVIVGLLAREAYDVATAERAMVLFCVFPGSVAMSWAASEPLFVLCSAACLLAMWKRRWVLGGVVAAVATATSPLGVALVLACVVASATAMVRGRQWRAMATALMAPIGAIVFIVFLGRTTGERWAWFRVQGELLDDVDPLLPIRHIWRFVDNPLTNAPHGPTYLHTTVAVVTLGLGVFFAVRQRLPLPWLVFAAAVGAMSLLPWIGPPRPRLVWAAFPFAIAAAAWSARLPRRAWELFAAGSLGSLMVFEILYGRHGALP